MKEIVQIGKGFLLGLVLVLAVVVWKSFPFKHLYVSDMNNWEVVQWFWAQPARDTTIDGKSLIIQEKHYEKGIGTHANSIIKVPIPPGYTHFVADVGVSDEIADEAPSSVIFRVWGDGVILYESPVLHANTPPHRVDVNIQWTGELLLEVNDADDGNNSDHGVWGDARFVRR